MVTINSAQPINGLSTVTISPVKAKYQDPSDCTALGVRIFNDNLMTECNIYWELYYSVVTPGVDGGDPTTTWVTSTNGNLVISGTDYTNWNGNNEYPFTFTAAQLNLTIVQ
jgi:hypothetical protein